MAYVIVTPYFNPGGNTPVMLRFNELRRKEKPDIEGGQTLKSSIKQKQMM